MTKLAELVRSAAAASPAERIEWRDPIAAHGEPAIAAMAAWLGDTGLGAFAASVLERIANDHAHRTKVLDTLRSVDPRDLPAHVARDVADVINRIPGGTARARADPGRRSGNPVEQWPGDRDVTALELRFHEAMLDIYRQAGEATRRRRADGSFERGYWANYFLRGVRSHGGPAYARQLLRASGTTTGFERLKGEGRLDIAMEALVLHPEFQALFTGDDLRVAAQRLKAAGYFPSQQ
jgi:hypothetical protein